ncbi:TIGR01777 family oxidoreductase [Puia dinghuensis]|uniref:NAD-dependent epimerase n=1 Tax=Puia dinghuensis TaxID=1792502 RepID=A0A8J2UEK2_9BACT|nr:TIGR01777 family oxidoreductase [Puia dinghuensis]GGB05756.1 NAD-dependent epimerase [Puia dinghuensis]
MSTILITGGTGLIGTALSTLLREKGHRVMILSRGAAPSQPDTFRWDPDTGYIDPEAIREADFIIHLAGAGVADKRWSAKRKKVIEESRTKSAALLVQALTGIPNRVKAVISASGIGWYGADAVIPNPRPFQETDPADGAFLGETCRRWEEAIAPVATLGKRLVIFRTGIALSTKGGALVEFRKPLRFGAAAILGSGKQVASWIHIEDLCRLYLHAIEHDDCSGVFNAVAPRPVDNRTLTLALARQLKGRYFVPVYVPSFLLKIMIGEMSIEVLKSTTVSAEKVRSIGFQFIYPSIEKALAALLPRN